MKIAASLDMNGLPLKDGSKVFTLPSATGTLATLADIPKGSFIIKGEATSVSQDNTTLVTTKGETIVAGSENIGWVFQLGNDEYVSNGSVWVRLGQEINLIGTKLANGNLKIDLSNGNST